MTDVAIGPKEKRTSQPFYFLGSLDFKFIAGVEGMRYVRNRGEKKRKKEKKKK